MNAHELRRIERAKTLEELHAWAASIRSRLLAATKRKNGKATPSPQEKRRKDHNLATAELRSFVWTRCGSRCEACRTDLGEAWEMHHVENAGSRRPKQRAGNVLALCWECHRLIHRGDLETLRKVAAAPTLDAEARREAQHRVDKLIEARGVPVLLKVAP